MEIANGLVATIHYTLTDDAGEVIDQSSPDNPLSYLHGAGNIVPGLEKALAGKRPGESVQVDVVPAEGYSALAQSGLCRENLHWLEHYRRSYGTSLINSKI